MLTPPAISAETISAFLGQTYALCVTEVTFLPIGADVNAAVYRIVADDGTAYFLKLRRGDFDDIAVTVPAYLHEQGIVAVMAPLPTHARQLWAREHGFVWILYPFFEGHNGFQGALTERHWTALGQALRAVHAAVLPPALTRRVPREEYAPQWRDIVKGFVREAATHAYEDPIARQFAAFWRTKHDEICMMLERTEQLAQALARQDGAYVLCHTDLHAGNVLVGARDELTIVDWDAPIFAPKERDLMFMGGGVGRVWDTAREEALFYAGYGPTAIDPVALAYYRYERIIEDLAAYGNELFGAQGSVEDREHGLTGTMAQFLPHHLVEIAHNTYLRLPEASR